MQATRQAILDHLRRFGEATVRDLADLLHLTATGIRQHLTILERDSLVAIKEARGRVGRPALVYQLTSAGEAQFPSRYDELSNLMLDEIRAIAGSKGLQSVLMRVAARSAEVYEPRLRNKPLAGRVDEAAQIISERGCMADVRRSNGNEYLIHQ